MIQLGGLVSEMPRSLVIKPQHETADCGTDSGVLRLSRYDGGIVSLSKNAASLTTPSPTSPISPPVTPPLSCPRAPPEVLDRDMDCAIMEQHLDWKDWAMWQRLSAAGIKGAASAIPPEKVDGGEGQQAQGFSESEMFALEL